MALKVVRAARELLELQGRAIAAARDNTTPTNDDPALAALEELRRRRLERAAQTAALPAPKALGDGTR